MYRRHGSVITNNRNIVATGYNINFGKTKIKNKWSEHAEEAAINNVKKMKKKQYQRYRLWVIRLNPCMDLVNSKPCPMCDKYIKKVGIRYVYYSVST
jgi:tRNA(Arg) A34 adenosine deaminase TadA